VTAQISIDPEQVADFCRRHEVQELALFGSVLREDFGPRSDVDLLVTFTPGARVSLFDLVDMGEDLSRLFGRRVDLVLKRGLKARIRRSVLESSEVIYAAA
jgi:predicted nucleotidyltransferase